LETITQLLRTADHRPWQLPAGAWQYYQEWNDALFLHWQVPVELVQPFIPAGLKEEEINGSAWISLVAFTMERVRPRYLPALDVVSNFHELNLRTYVTKDGKPGVYFLSIEAQKYLSVMIAKSLSGLPYEKAIMSRKRQDKLDSYVSHNKMKSFSFEAQYEVGEAISNRSALDNWLTERYCMYLKEGASLYRYDVHHAMWDIQQVNLGKLRVQYQIGQLQITDKQPALVHYSKGVKVVAWGKTRV
jgi:uncharacterized protein